MKKNKIMMRKMKKNKIMMRKMKKRTIKPRIQIEKNKPN